MKIAIIGGAGTIGSCSAFILAHQGMADELVLMDSNKNALQSHVMDISTSLTGRRDMNVYAGDNKDLPGSDIVIISASVPAAGSTPREELIRVNFPLIRAAALNVEKYCRQSTVIIVTNPIDSLTYAFSRCCGINSKQIIGYNLNDSLRFQKAIATAFNTPSTEIEAMVLGEHVYNLVMLFSSIRISGKQVEITQDVKNQLNEYVPTMLKAFIKVSTNRTAGWTSAAGIATLVQAITNDSDRIIPCSTTLCGQYGFTGISMGVPVVLGSGGIKEIIELDLPDDEKTQMNKAAQSLYPAALTIEQMVTG